MPTAVRGCRSRVNAWLGTAFDYKFQAMGIARRRTGFRAMLEGCQNNGTPRQRYDLAAAPPSGDPLWT